MATFSIDGFDPLSIEYSSEENETLLDQANRRIILNILKSYTGYFDIFSETLQNAFDATEAKLREVGEGYEPKIWIEIDIENARVRVTDMVFRTCQSLECSSTSTISMPLFATFLPKPNTQSM
jgi:hypothetical protein